MRARTKVKLCRLSVLLGLLTIFYFGAAIESLTFIESCMVLSIGMGLIYMGKGFAIQKK